MASHKVYTHNIKVSKMPFDTQRGFSLIEIIMVIGILSVVASLTAFSSMDNYRGNAFRNERNTIVSILQKARSQSLSNMCFGALCTDGKSHGVHFQNGLYTIFQGSTYATRDVALDETIQASATVQNSGLTNIVFSQLSGDVATVGALTVTDNLSHSSVISINSEGQISWTN